jgi:acetyl esterase
MNVAVAGESAGGNLAAAVSIMARDKGAQLPVHQLLVYPIATYDFTTPSYQKHAKAKPLDKAMMQWFFEKYLRSPEDGKNPWISLVDANLKGLPAATIIRAEIDPLESDGRMLEQKLEAAGVKVDGKTVQGVTHEFFGMASIVPEAKEWQAYAVKKLKEAFERK